MQCLIFILAFVGFSYAKITDFKPYNETAYTMFLANDFDGDGSFTRSELDRVFLVYDTNHDGRVTRHEYTTYITDATPSLQDFAHILFDDYDMNKDHHLDKQDYNAYYAKVDANDDGSIDSNEFITYWTKIFTENEHLHSHGAAGK